MSTERTVNGLKVLGTYSVHSPLSTEGKPVYFRRMERLELEFGNEVYACRECGHVDDSVGKIRGHLGKEHPSDKALANREKKKKRDKEIATQILEPAEQARPEPEEEQQQEEARERSVMDYTIAEVVGMATENRDLRKENEELTQSRDKWKTKAYDAEKSLQKIRKALG